MQLQIIGAGLAGLLAANLLRKYNPTVYEQQPSLPNNHHALLRFRSSQVSDALGIEFKKVSMIKASQNYYNPVAACLAYSSKVTGVARSDRSIVANGLEIAERWIAPPDLGKRMSEGLDIIYGIGENKNYSGTVISTIPMEALMVLLDYPDRPDWFPHRTGSVISVQVPSCEAYATVYCPDSAIDFYRASITGDLLQAEYAKEIHPEVAKKEIYVAMDFLGLGSENHPISWNDVEFHTQKYAKILPIDERIRKHFIHWATKEHDIYSLGRFATWRPGLLLDDLVKDIRLIESWMTSGSHYDARIKA